MRSKIEADGGEDFLLPGQQIGFGITEPDTLFMEAGTGVLVLAKPSENLKTGRIDGLAITGSDQGGIVINTIAHNDSTATTMADFILKLINELKKIINSLLKKEKEYLLEIKILMKPRSRFSKSLEKPVNQNHTCGYSVKFAGQSACLCFKSMAPACCLR